LGVDQIGEEDAKGDRELVAGNEAAAKVRGRQFSSVKRRRDGRHADADSDDETPYNEDSRIRRGPLNGGAEGE
jgi:hypothetical protein